MPHCEKYSSYPEPEKGAVDPRGTFSFVQAARRYCFSYTFKHVALPTPTHFYTTFFQAQAHTSFARSFFSRSFRLRFPRVSINAEG